MSEVNGLSDKELKELALSKYKQQVEQQHPGSKFPTEIIDLPSKGKCYPLDNPLSSGKVEMKYMTAREEDILSSLTLVAQGVVLDRLFQSLIVSNINYSDLTIGDKNAIMVAARILGYGAEYPVKVKCPNCGTENKTTVDLKKLKETPLDVNALKEVNSNMFEFTLPHTKRIVVYRLLTTGDDKQIKDELLQAKKEMKSSGINRELSTRLKQHIISVDGETSRKYISEFVNDELLSRDSIELRKHMNTVSHDVIFEFEFECDNLKCGYTTDEMGLPIDSNFFWPRA